MLCVSYKVLKDLSTTVYNVVIDLSFYYIILYFALIKSTNRTCFEKHTLYFYEQKTTNSTVKQTVLVTLTTTFPVYLFQPTTVNCVLNPTKETLTTSPLGSRKTKLQNVKLSANARTRVASTLENIAYEMWWPCFVKIL